MADGQPWFDSVAQDPDPGVNQRKLEVPIHEIKLEGSIGAICGAVGSTPGKRAMRKLEALI